MFMAMFSADLKSLAGEDVAVLVVSATVAALVSLCAADSAVSVDLLQAVSTKVQLTATANNE
jgi:hypothetical protein